MTSLLLRWFIRDPEDTSPKARAAYGRLSGGVGLACNLFLFGIKLTVGLLSASISIIADAFNNLSDMGSSLVTLLGFKLASRPADEKHPYGHGRLEYMTGFIVSVLIVLVGFELFRTAIGKIITPEEIDVTLWTIAALVASILVKLWMYLFNRKIGKQIASAAILATARDSLNDAISTSAVLVAALIYRFTGVNVDGVAALLVSGFILYGGFMSAVDTINPLLGTPPSKEFVEDLRHRVMSYDLFTGVHDLIVHDYGPGRRFASIHIEVPADVDVLRCHEEIDRCEREVGEALGILLVAHMDPVEDGESVRRYREVVLTALREIDDKITMHDFRVVRGENASNLIFDIVVPFGYAIDNDELCRMIEFQVQKQEPTFHCVIQVDRSYT